MCLSKVAAENHAELGSEAELLLGLMYCRCYTKLYLVWKVYQYGVLG